MSIDMYVQASTSQGESVADVCQREIANYQMLINNMETFVSETQLRSKTYHNAKLFYGQVLIPLAKAGILLSEAVHAACQKFPNQYLATVDSSDLSSSKLEAQIQQFETNILRLQEIQNTLEATLMSDVLKNASLSVNDKIMDNLMNSKRYLEEKLTVLLDFHERSPQFFAEIKELESIVNRGVQQAETSWSVTSGSFHIPPVSDLAWTKDIETKWDIRAERIKREKLEAEEEEDAYHFQMIDELSKYDLRLWEYKQGFDDPTFSWFIEKDGQRVFNEELEAYLDEYGEFIDENMYMQVDHNYLEEKELEAQKNGKSYLTNQQFDGLQKIMIQASSNVTTVAKQGLALSPLTASRGLRGHNNQISSNPNKKNKNESNIASNVKSNKSLGSNGKFTDPVVESQYQSYVNRKERARNNGHAVVTRDRLDWKQASDYWRKDSPMARGNRFNQTARDSAIYDYYEVNLKTGKRLDSYDPQAGEIVSRKAIDLDKTSRATLKKHLEEFEDKYKKGTVIRSNAYEELDGLKLEGEYILEIPASNIKSEKLSQFKELATEYDVTLRFLEE